MPDAGVASGYAASFEPAMRLAMEQAARTNTGPPAGSADPTAHAEIVAIRQAAETTGCWRLDGYTLVVTLEPCTMCAGAVLNARIRRLVYGAANPRAGAAGSLWDVVRDRRLGPAVEVIAGVLAVECAE